MRLLRSFPVLAFCLVLLSLAGYCLSQKSLVLLLVAGTLAIVSWYVTEGPRGRTLPSWASHLLVLGVSLNVLFDWYQNQGDWMGVLGRYAVWLTVIKLFEHKTQRDYSQLFAFSFLLMVIGSLQSADLLFSLVLVVYIALGVYVLLLHQMHGAYEREKDDRNNVIPRGYRLAPILKPVIGPRVGVQFRLFALILGLGGLLLSILVFLAFPRGIGEDKLPGLPSAIKRRVAFLDQVNLGGGSRITDSRRPIMRVQILDQDGVPLTDAPFFMRAGVLDQYLAGGKWRAVPHEPVVIDATANEFSPLADNLADETSYVVQHVKLDMAFDQLPSIATPVSIQSSSISNFEYNPVTQIIRKPPHVGRLMAYDIRAQTRPSQQTRDTLLHDSDLDRVWRDTSRYRSRRVRELATELLSRSGEQTSRPIDPRMEWSWNRRAADSFNRYLQSSLYTYTLDLSDVSASAPDNDPIAQFLFDTKKGHCEYFASALAAMCHTVGIQARLVIGYVAYEYNESTREYIISESNAHAWVEVRTCATTWEAFDPTPPAVLSDLHNVQASLSDGVQRIWSNLENGIGSNFLEFDASLQANFTALMDMGWTERLGTLWQTARDFSRRVNESFKLGPAGYIWMGIVALALFIAIIALIKLMRRSIAIRRVLHLQHLSGREYQRMLHQLGFYIDMLYVLRKGGHEKPYWQPPAQFADGLVEADPEIAECVHVITDVFYASRYGKQPLRKLQSQTAQNSLRELASLLHVKM